MSGDRIPPSPFAAASSRAWIAAALLAIAVAVRLAGIASAPLDPLEASHAIAAWTSASGAADLVGRLEPPPSSALLVGLDRWLFWVASHASDVLARVPTALVGCAVVLLPLALASVGAAGGLALAVLLAIDPWWIAESRRADGAILGAAAALACMLLLVRLAAAEPAPALESAARRQWTAWSAAAGLLLVSGTAAWDFLPPVLAAVVLLRGPRSGDRLRARPRLGALAAAVAVAGVVGATGLLVDWSALRLVSASLDAWLASFDASAAVASAPAVAVLAGSRGTHAIALAFRLAVGAIGLWGLVRAWRRPTTGGAAVDRSVAEALAVWLLWGLVLQLRPGADAPTALALELPLLLAAALGFEQVAAARRGAPAPGRRAIAAVATALATAVALAGFRPLVAEDRVTLPPARQLARDLRVLEERPAAERPIVEVESPGAVDAVLAWYLRDSAVRWVAQPSVADDSTPRVALRRRTAPIDSAPPRSRGYAVARAGADFEIIELH